MNKKTIPKSLLIMVIVVMIIPLPRVSALEDIYSTNISIDNIVQLSNPNEIRITYHSVGAHVFVDSFGLYHSAYTDLQSKLQLSFNGKMRQIAIVYGSGDLVFNVLTESVTSQSSVPADEVGVGEYSLKITQLESYYGNSGKTNTDTINLNPFYTTSINTISFGEKVLGNNDVLYWEDPLLTLDYVDNDIYSSTNDLSIRLNNIFTLSKATAEFRLSEFIGLEWKGKVSNLQFRMAVPNLDGSIVYGPVKTITVNALPNRAPTIEINAPQGTYGGDDSSLIPFNISVQDLDYDTVEVKVTQDNPGLIVGSMVFTPSINEQIYGGILTGLNKTITKNNLMLWTGEIASYVGFSCDIITTSPDSLVSMTYTDVDAVSIYVDFTDPNIILDRPLQGGFYNQYPDFTGSISSEYLITEIQLEFIDSEERVIYNKTEIDMLNPTFEILNEQLENGHQWNDLSEGLHQFRLSATNNLGAIGEQIVSFYKKVTPPTVLDWGYESGEIFGITPPNFSESGSFEFSDYEWATAFEFHYILSENPINISDPSDYWKTPINGFMINAADWGAMNEGTVYCDCYLEDQAANYAHTTLIFEKDISNPLIAIEIPLNDSVFGETAPYYRFEVSDPHFLDALGHPGSVEYTLDNHAGISIVGLIPTPIMLNSPIFEGQIDAAAWGQFSAISSRQTVDLIISAQDALGNEAIAMVHLICDPAAPTITYSGINQRDVFAMAQPSYSLTIEEETALNSVWYELDGQRVNLTTALSQSITIPSGIWLGLTPGMHTIVTYALDSADNLGYTTIQIIKDLNEPIVSINSPQEDAYHNVAPTITLTVTDYSLIYLGIAITSPQSYVALYNDVPYLGFNLTKSYVIDTFTWNNLPEGANTIYILASDVLGRNTSQSFVVNKDSYFQGVQIQSPLQNAEVSAEFSVKMQLIEPHFDKVMISTDLGLTFNPIGMIELGSNLYEGMVNQSITREMVEGLNAIILQVYDLAGNSQSFTISLNLDRTVPVLILDEDNVLISGAEPIDLDLMVEENHLECIRYIFQELTYSLPTSSWIVNGERTYVSFSVDIGTWASLGSGEYDLTLLVRDYAQNEISMTIRLEKDITLPFITILSPELNASVGGAAPEYEILIEEDHLQNLWYTLNDNITRHYITSRQGMIEATAWTSAYARNVTITFYAEDLYGNIGSERILVNRSDYYAIGERNTHDSRSPLDLVELLLNMDTFEKVTASGVLVIGFSIGYVLDKKKTQKDRELAATLATETSSWDILEFGK